MATSAAPVVVGVDGSDTALDAIEWAAAEAAARGRPLRVVHSYARAAPVDPPGDPAVGDHRHAAEEVLDEAVARARAVAPDLSVARLLVAGPAVRVLVDQTRDATLVVLGRSRSGRMRGLLGRSTGARVAAHADCPVAVVGPFEVVAPGPSAARVVVGIDGSTRSDEAVGYAFEAAGRRGTGLTAVHAWALHGPADLDGDADDRVANHDAQRRVLDDAVRTWSRRFPHVSVQAKLVRDHPGRALVAESAGAALTVLGCGGRGSALGPVGRMVLRHIHSPVAVLGPRS